MALYPAQDSFTRGEVSPRLHARATLDLYRAALAKCENFLTLPHGGIRKRGGTYFAGEVKTSAKETRIIPFIFSADQAYALEVGDLYIRVYAYGARVGTVEVVTPWVEADIWELQFHQSADVMWITHPDYQTRTLTRTAHTTWTLATLTVEDGPYLAANTTATTLTPAAYGSAVPVMTTNTAPSGTASDSSGSVDTWKIFDKDKGTGLTLAGTLAGWVAYDFAGSATKVVDAYYIKASLNLPGNTPGSWTFEGYDGASWVVLDTRTTEANWVRGEVRFYEFHNQTAFEAYRLKWDALSAAVATDSSIVELGIHERAEDQTAFNLTASSTTGINDNTGFQTTDVGRHIRLRDADGEWRWARIIARTSTTVVTVQVYGHALTSLQPIANWRLGTWSTNEGWPESVTVFEERLALSKRFQVNASRTSEFDVFTPGEADDDALEFLQAGGGQANDIVWLADADGFLVIATTGGIRSLSGSGIDEALTPSSFKNRRSRAFGAAKIRPVDAGSSFLYVTRSRRTIAKLSQNQSGRFTSDDVGQISEHIPKKGVVEIAFQSDPDPLLWFPLDNGEVGGYTHQPSQEVRGMHRHRVGGTLTGADWAAVESCCVTPGQSGADDVWFIVKRTIGGSTKRYIEVMQAAFEYDDIENAFQVDCGLSRTGSAVASVSGLSHLTGESVDVLADGKVYKGLTVTAGAVTLPGGATAATWHVGLPYEAVADTLELDVGGKDGSILGRRKKVGRVLLSLLETDTTGLEIKSLQRGRWETVKIPTIVQPDGMANLFTGNVSVPIDDSWEGQGRVTIRHTNPTPCTIRAITPIFDAEP